MLLYDDGAAGTPEDDADLPCVVLDDLINGIVASCNGDDSELVVARNAVVLVDAPELLALPLATAAPSAAPSRRGPTATSDSAPHSKSSSASKATKSGKQDGGDGKQSREHKAWVKKLISEWQRHIARCVCSATMACTLVRLR